MKALVLTGKEKVEMQEVAKPRAVEGEVLLRVSTAGICGSDIHGFLGHSPRRKPGLILGHEAVGVIAELGPGDYFGEIGLLRGVPRVATVRTLTPCRLYRMPGQEFLDILTQSALRSRTLTRAAQSRLAELPPGTERAVR